LELETFLRQKKTHYDTQRVAIDREGNKKIWLNGLDRLYTNINAWLHSLIQEKVVAVNYEEMILAEDFMASYRVKNMHITVGTELVSLKPMGMNVIGAAGRVDMEGEEGTVMLVLLSKEVNHYQWYIVVRTSQKQYFPLVKESFTDALEQVMRKDD
jgi:hypothetical protein